MSDYTDEESDDRDDGATADGLPRGLDEPPQSYRSGRVRIIGAEPAGNAIREVTGPVVEENLEMQHWNDAPTGQVPAILDRATGDEPLLAPPIWREEETDWEAHEELFEPSMLSDDLPAVGSLMNNNNELVDVVRQPWHFDAGELPSDDQTMMLEPDAPPDSDPVTTITPAVAKEPAQPTAATTAAAASRLSPPGPPQARVRAPRASRQVAGGRNTNAGGTNGRNMRVAFGSGLLLGLATLLCFYLGNLASMVLASAIGLLAAAEGFAAFRRAQYHPATLLGLVAVLSLMVETYNKGVSALPLVLVLLVAGSFIWYLSNVEVGADPVAGMVSTVLVFAWVGGLFPHRHGVAFFMAAVLTTVAADVAGLLVGSAVGRHPMAPSISPNKTWEGFLGGAVASVLMAVVVVHFIHPWTVSKALVLGLVVAVVAPLGDLSQSMVKRHLGVKDMGRLMPGHGGILDRVDGLLFVLPATYFVVKALHLG
jgi:phosphatidate cytidylyltransferase